MKHWIALDRTIVEHSRGFQVLARGATYPTPAPTEVRAVIRIPDHRQPHALPSAFALLRQNLAQRVREWLDRKAERERGTELKVQRIRETWERKP